MRESIVYKKRNELNIEKWDTCIDASSNGLIYAQSWWLDTMADNWDALVIGDYEVVMPLTWRRKWGIKYLYQPAFTQQLGVISAQDISTDMVEAFIDTAKKYFRFAEINLNFKNKVNGSIARNNFVLDLNRPYEEIRSGYKKNLRRNLEKADIGELNYRHYDGKNDTNDIIGLFKKTYFNNRKMGVQNDDFELLKGVFSKGYFNYTQVRAITNEDNIHSAVCFLKDRKRLYFLLPVSPVAMRNSSAGHLLVDRIINEFSLQNFIFDFEGSDLPGVSQFYQGYGSENQPFYFIRWNNLSWPISLLKNYK